MRSKLGRPANKIEFTKEWIINFPHYINENGCWIPPNKAMSTGYVQIMSNGDIFYLHRLSMCIHYNIDYHNPKVDTRHNDKCDKRCFFYEHLKPGTASENELDKVKAGNHHNARKTNCPKCGSIYETYVVKSGWDKGKVGRRCPMCMWRRNNGIA